jgi:hypothetical protein
MRVLICGDRNWNNFEVVEKFILSLSKDTVIIEGDCRGADKIAGYIGRKHGYDVIPFPAKWKEYGNRAGPIRNQQMLDEGKPDLVVAFHNDLEHSRGTKDMVNRAKASGFPVKIIREDDDVSNNEFS